MAAAWGRLEHHRPGAGGERTCVELNLAGKLAFTVGRRKDCDLRLEGDFFSGLHCTIRHSDAGATIENNSGTNGTWVEGAKGVIHLSAKGQSTRLSDGALISLVVPAADAAKKFKDKAAVYKFHCPIDGSSTAVDTSKMMPPPPASTAAAAAKRNVVCRTQSRAVRVLEDVYDVDYNKPPLGVGQFGKVVECIDRATGTSMAVKLIKKRKFPGASRSSQRLQFMKSMQSEVDIMKRINHPNIVNVKDIFENDDMLSIVMERVHGGELYDFIIDSVEAGSQDYVGGGSKANNGLQESVSKLIVAQILEAVRYLHANQIVHRDLKPENILLQSRPHDGSCPLVKLADFGTGATKASVDILSRTYFAPEVHKRGQKYGKPCDMWSVGVVVYVMLSGIPPFYDHDEDTQDLGAANGLSMTEAICTASYDFPSPEWDGISDTARDFVKRLLVVDPGQRLSAVAALGHPWMDPVSKASAKAIRTRSGSSREVDADSTEQTDSCLPSLNPCEVATAAGGAASAENSTGVRKQATLGMTDIIQRKPNDAAASSAGTKRSRSSNHGDSKSTSAGGDGPNQDKKRQRKDSTAVVWSARGVGMYGDSTTEDIEAAYQEWVAAGRGDETAVYYLLDGATHHVDFRKMKQIRNDDATRNRALTRETLREYDRRKKEESKRPQLDRKTRKQKGRLFESQGNHPTY